ncbi:MAG: lipocalin family protein [Bacteroidales bacterium]|nr:lipocalin family protein [Bacteroidales bacterium]
MMTKLGVLALASMFVLSIATSSCDPEGKPDNNEFDITLANGTWQCDTASMNGELIYGVNLRLTLNSNLTGEMVNNGYLPFYGTSFTYAISGNTITITPPNDPTHTFTIEKLTANTLQFSGSLDNDIPAATFYFHKATSNPIDEQLLIGHWASTRMLYDGEEANESVLLDFYEDHTGLGTFDGVTENNDFTWSMNGDRLTIIPRGDTNVVTVHELSTTTLHFSGMVELDHNEMRMEGWFARMMTD